MVEKIINQFRKSVIDLTAAKEMSIEEFITGHYLNKILTDLINMRSRIYDKMFKNDNVETYLMKRNRSIEQF